MIAENKRIKGDTNKTETLNYYLVDPVLPKYYFNNQHPRTHKISRNNKVIEFSKYL